MQTRLAPQYQNTPAGQQAERVLRSCVHCGFCNATCPTYRVTGNELDGPRGRIYLMKQVFEGQAPTATTQAHLDRCIGCRHCESTCPSGVQYHELLSVGQAAVDAQVRRPWPLALRRALLRQFVPSRLFGPMLALGRLARPVLPAALARQVPVLPDQPPGPWPEADAAKRDAHAVPYHARVILPEGCVQPHLRPHIDTATARVLDALGFQVVRVSGARCCGAIKGHLGDEAGAREQARRNVDAWLSVVHDGQALPVAAVVVNASGCGAWAADYAHLLSDDPTHADKGRQAAALVRDPATLVAEHLHRMDWSHLKPARTGMRVTFQPPCSFSHGLKLSRAAQPGPVENTLRQLGWDVSWPAVDSHQCCGAGGAYSLLQPDMSAPLKTAKVDSIAATRPDVVVSANIGCITHLQADLPVPVKHWIELLDEALRTAPC